MEEGDEEMSDENKIVSLEHERLSRLPMLDTNLKDVMDLTKAYLNQLISMGHKEISGSFPVDGKEYLITIKET